MLYGFEYFCGANVILKLNNMPILEANGLSLTINESKRPIYGYSRRHFNAVASGQVLVQGNLAINYVHQDYLWYAINDRINSTINTNSLIQPDILQDYMSNLGNNPSQDSAVISSLKNQFWSNNLNSYNSSVSPTRNPHDNGSGLNLHITFGDQDLSYKSNGKTGILVSNMHFVGRSMTLAINEETVVEIFPFIAQDLLSLEPNGQYTYTTNSPTSSSLDNTTTIGNK